jgi:bifunctional pyridoxal-dependent enzyme with beta-cystathionase and maltose regulon repressor activities
MAIINSQFLKVVYNEIQSQIDKKVNQFQAVNRDIKLIRLNSGDIWVESPYGSSWKLFDKLLKECHILSALGERFGPRGKGFVRLCSFANQTKVIIAGTRIADMKI